MDAKRQKKRENFFWGEIFKNFFSEMLRIFWEKFWCKNFPEKFIFRKVMTGNVGFTGTYYQMPLWCRGFWLDCRGGFGSSLGKSFF